MKSPDIHPLERRFDEIKAELQLIDPYQLSFRTGTIYEENDEGGGEFKFEFWGDKISVQFPTFEAKREQDQSLLDPFFHTLLGYYFQLSDGAPLTGQWISFSALPDGMFYKSAFQGYTGNKLTHEFGDDIEAFRLAARQVGGKEITHGDAAYAFKILPMFQMAVACWLGDEDFPTSHRILFDSSASHHLSADACAVVGSVLTGNLIKAKMRG
jgi:hypothetical protein